MGSPLYMETILSPGLMPHQEYICHFWTSRCPNLPMANFRGFPELPPVLDIFREFRPAFLETNRSKFSAISSRVRIGTCRYWSGWTMSLGCRPMARNRWVYQGTFS